MSQLWVENTESIDWDELSELYRVAPLGDKPAEYLRVSFTNSRFVIFVYDEGRLVGAGRVLADGVDCAYLCDIALRPAYQGCGLGRQIVERLVELAKGHRKIILYAVKGKEPFYKKFGFKRMLTAMALFANPEEAVAKGTIADD